MTRSEPRMGRTLFENLTERASAINARIVFPEGADERVISAALAVQRAGAAQPLLLGDPDAVRAAADPGDIPIINPKTADNLAALAAAYAAQRKNIKESVAMRLVKKPLMYGAMLVHTGEADGMVAGCGHATTSVLQAAGLCIGYAPGVPCPSSIMLMNVPDVAGLGPRIMAFADPAVTVDPTPEELAAMAVQSGINFRRFTGEAPVVALLSFSTKGSAAHAHVDKVAQAAELARNAGADFAIDGELQADAAVSPRVAEKKVKDSPVAGRANVLVFPDLDAANIAYKLTQYLAGADAIGPILQGFKKPVNDLSRGASAEDIQRVTVLTVLQCAD